MAFLAVRILSLGSRCQRLSTTSKVFRQQKLNVSSSGCQSTEEAFWDIEGSVAVDPTNIEDLTYLNSVMEEKDTPKVEESDFVRITKFGHIRLDVDNPGLELNSENDTRDSETFNFIDKQFFGDKLSSHVSSPILKHDAMIQAEDVPVDTNPVDQQYFYPNTGVKDKSNQVLHGPSASELEFKENEVDNQYFGKKGEAVSPGANVQTPVSRVSAYNYLRTLQAKAAQAPSNNTGESVNSDETSPNRLYADMIPNLYKMPNDMIVHLLKKSIIYKKDGIVAIDKPYGLVTTDADRKAPIILTNLLPYLSEILRFKKLYSVHRLDRDTTGVLLLASNQDVADRLNKLFLNHQIKKTYLAITRGIPDPTEGTINIPLCERNVGDRQRMSLRPILEHSEDVLRSAKYNAKGKSFQAVTHFKMDKSSKGAALVELKPETGVRHQLRVHLSEALNCPVLGDHKYSHEDKFAPQKLPLTMLDCLGIKQSKVRIIPMHLHAASVRIPGFGEEGKDLFIHTPPPPFFRYTMKKLKLYKPRSKQ